MLNQVTVYDCSEYCVGLNTELNNKPSTILCVCVCVPVCGSVYELVTGLPESDLPHHFYTDQPLVLVLLCLLLILPLSIPKEISFQKYIRSETEVFHLQVSELLLQIHTTD